MEDWENERRDGFRFSCIKIWTGDMNGEHEHCSVLYLDLM